MLSLERFSAMWRALGARDDDAHVGGHGKVRGPVGLSAGARFARLRDAYREPHRAYHTDVHIGACLERLDDPAVAALASRLPEVEAALWFHDVVYDTHARDNEEKSAEWWLADARAASIGEAVAQRIAAYIRATRDHQPSPLHAVDSQLVIDIDLSILGEARDVFARFENEIRSEYGWVEPAAYVAGRAQVLRRFLERPAIYGTVLFRDRYERSARANLEWALERLVARA